ncbi:uncharacterized protein LOC119674655 [Teleopsis dalmanni]|uniref:uncharacterized protein LOC119674655 n=1 Tax=Teleopsis dalmanni TaxID=139649 RepID=UPI0018CCD607|nr:uncharacterized protein LOC119674655 [Teleopsis dalmanni]
MDENTINYFNNSGDGFLMEEFMSDDSECNEITSATHNVGVVKLASTKKYGHNNLDDADEESNETEYPSCSKERKRRIVWSKNAETFLLELWEKYFVELRSVRKNAHIYSKIAEQLKQKSGHKFSGHEVKIKIQNVQSKYLDERKKMGLSGGTSSTWVHFSKVHSIVGDYKSLNVVPSVKEDAESSYQDTNPYNSDYEFQSPSFRSEPRKKKKITDKQEELISVTDTTNRFLKGEVVIKNKRTINSKNQTALLEEEYLIDEFLSDNSESSEPTESADEESNETEYPSCSKERKRRIVWTKYAERLLLELWDKNVAELRSERKNSHVYREIADQLITNGHKFSGHEVKTKIQNLHTKYKYVFNYCQ